MIKIRIANPIKLRPTPLSPKSGFVSFPYDSKLVVYIKSLGTRTYLPESKTWEVPLTAIPTICNTLTKYDIEITGELVKDSTAFVQLPEEFSFYTQPYRHQLEGVLHGLSHDTFLLGDDQGLGKSKEAIDLAIARKHRDGLKRCLIICGVNGNKYNWVDEIKIHSGQDAWVIGTRYTKRAPVKMIEGTSRDKLDDLMKLPSNFFLITNIETLRQLKTTKGKKTIFPIAERIQELCELNEIGMVVFDEAHKAKNPTSQQGKALLKIKPKYALPMSGTFLVNSPLDLYVPLKWAGFETHSFYQYKRHYCVMGGYGGSEVIGYQNLDELRAIMDKAMLRRTKDDVLDLPPKVHTVEYVEMGKNQNTIYEEVKQELRQNIDKIKLNSNPLAQMIRLRQATGCPSILSSTMTQSAKLDRLEELIEDMVAVGQKAVVYSQWEQVTRVIKERLAKYNPAYITGDVKTEDRMAEIEKFQKNSNCKVIIGTIGAMGTGITLTAASNVIFIDEPWNRALKDQAEDRAHRIGTKGVVSVITIVCKDTIDEKIMNLVYKKGRMSDMLIDGKIDGTNRSAIVDYLLS